MLKLALQDNPRLQGKALTGRYSGQWRYRVGDYRLICNIQDDIVVILVLELGHRKEVYRKQNERRQRGNANFLQKKQKALLFVLRYILILFYARFFFLTSIACNGINGQIRCFNGQILDKSVSSAILS